MGGSAKQSAPFLHRRSTERRGGDEAVMAKIECVAKEELKL
jgi:hypothetical protein